MARVRPVRSAIAIVAVLSGLLGATAPDAGAGLPALCKLPVAAQVKALSLVPTCSVGPVSKLSGSARERQVLWGTQGNLAGLSEYRNVGIVVYTGVSATTFATDYALGSGTGVPVPIGQGGREEVEPHMIVLSAYSGTVGFEAVFQVTPQEAAADKGAFLALVKAFASHL